MCLFLICAGKTALASAPELLCPSAPDSLQLCALDSLVDTYANSLFLESAAVKEAECNFMIESVADSAARTRVANRLYNHYHDSALMGDEEVAIFLWDNWFYNAKLRVIPSGGRSEEEEFYDRQLFADLNRPTLLGEKAPQLVAKAPNGARVKLPSAGEVSVLFFYDTDCGKCKLESAVLPKALESSKEKLVFYAFYTGSDRKAWKKWRQSFKLDNNNIKVLHVWDPHFGSDFLRLYGVISTPKLYVVNSEGRIFGRRLEVENLGGVLDLLYESEH